MQPGVWNATEPAFPHALSDVASPPERLYFLGNRDVLDGPCVSVVGTRHPTQYGQRVTKQLAIALARAGVCIVSGMALGVDGIAHRTALEQGGRTVAVLGTGIDIPYPYSHRSLYNDIVRKGLVVSEFGPGTKQFRGCFPRRNRIIAGLSEVTIIVEAGHKSGALITANYALEAGRTVAAIPGPIDSPASQGANHLLRDGAHVIASIEDVLMLAGVHSSRQSTVSTGKKTASGRKKADFSYKGGKGNGMTRNLNVAAELSQDEKAVWTAIKDGPLSTDTIINRTELTPERCLAAITQLEIKRIVVTTRGGEVTRV